MKSIIAKPLLRWYRSRTRSIPWRERPEPYAVWVAEIMAQQTRLETMLPYYQRWMQRFPTVHKLASANEQQVLALWEGLGYYSRARNLHKAARWLLSERAGAMPSSAAELQKLPGVGAYTAGAIASLAYGEDVPAVDGNAMRVLARLFDVELPVHTAAGRQRLWALAAEHLPRGQAADYNQALMDLGATVCAPHPKCSVCPLEAQCLARQRSVERERPVKRSTAQLPLRHYAAAIVRQAGKVLVFQRAASGLLAGMWEFPNVQIEAGSPKNKLKNSLKKQLGLSVLVGKLLGEYEHSYSHFRAQLSVYDCEMVSIEITAQRSAKWLTPRGLQRLPMGKLDRSVSRALLERT